MKPDAGVQTEIGDEPVRLTARALAHDFNNLIGAILGHASYLRMIAEPGSEVDQTAATIEMAAERARGLAVQLQQLGSALNAAKPATFTPVDLHEIVREVTATLGTGQPGPVRFTLKLSALNSVVRGDAGQLNQLMMNLAVNACEAMGADGGEIEFETVAVELAVQLEVRDSGPGIPADVRARIFDASYTTKRSGGGLGLAIVQQIAAAHGAVIAIDGHRPRGTVFRLRFPTV